MAVKEADTKEKTLKISEKYLQTIPSEIIKSINHEFYDQSFMGRELVVLDEDSFDFEEKTRTELLGYILNELGYVVCYVAISFETGDTNKLLYTQRLSDRYFQQLKRLTKEVKTEWSV